MASISIAQLQSEGNTNDVLIDVRTAGEYHGLHAENAINLPLDTISEEQVRKLANDHPRILVLCQSGNRAKLACDKLPNDLPLFIVEGGTTAWVEAGLPVVKGKGVISIERQVRIAAGLLVVLGVALGYWVHPGFLGLSAFVGLGLTFAGITNTCGMGLMLAKMPWNRRPCHNQGAEAK